MPVGQRGLLAFVLLPLLARVKALNDGRSPRYQRSLIRESLRKVGVVLLHNVQRCVPGEPAMVLGKQFVHLCKLFVSHGHRALAGREYTASHWFQASFRRTTPPGRAW